MHLNNVLNATRRHASSVSACTCTHLSDPHVCSSREQTRENVREPLCTAEWNTRPLRGQVRWPLACTPLQLGRGLIANLCCLEAASSPFDPTRREKRWQQHNVSTVMLMRAGQKPGSTWRTGILTSWRWAGRGNTSEAATENKRALTHIDNVAFPFSPLWKNIQWWIKWTISVDFLASIVT